MRISLTYIHPGRARAAILRPMGALDRSNYDELIGQAWTARAAGAQHLLVDLSDADRVSIAGLVGLHAVALIAQGGQPLDAEAGWDAIRALAEDSCSMRRLAILNPRPPVRLALEAKPFTNFLAIHADLDTALAALTA